MPPALRRRQLTLFVAEPERSLLNALRATLDPVQASLISAHVTLCREDEIDSVDSAVLFSRVASWPHGPLWMTFGVPQLFSGHGVLLPCEQGSSEFHQLRRWLLNDDTVRVHGAHLTLAHPRNPRSAGNTEAARGDCPQSLRARFATVALIEQDGAGPWTLLREAPLGDVGEEVQGAMEPHTGIDHATQPLHRPEVTARDDASTTDA